MRRTDEEFKAEVFRRSEAFETRRKKRRKKTAMLCLPVLLCCGALFAAMSVGFGASGKADFAADNAAAQSVECMEAPAAAEEGMDYHSFETQAAYEEGPAEAPGEGNGTMESASTQAVLTIDVVSQPEAEEYERTFTDPAQIADILAAIRAFDDDPATAIGGSEVGESEGMGYRITVTEEESVREYTLFNNALANDGTWYVNAERYQALEKLILEDD